ncbi:hypothetical protein C0Q70_05052 [Pomacea canaliculata]|uniref:XLR/SYCP3/FAM9 domain-containing protein n=1 Tax=Pomacea canaliculata TaxID=400727 RepID=A0A2T7PK29_POMCA|nr:hypothetical protein C0Q70_05052 [Pomacea canaliculata]
MPKQVKKNGRNNQVSPADQKKSTITFVNDDKCSIKSEESSPILENDEKTVIPHSGKKRTYEDEEAGGDFGLEMQKMLEMFGADISKTLSTKKKRLEHFTQLSLKTTGKKVEEILTAQQNERTRLQEEYCKQAESVFQQWENDIDKIKEQEEKLTNLFKQQQKLFQQSRIIQGQRLKTIRQLNEQFIKSVDELDKSHINQQNSLQLELKKEMALLQKRILMDMVRAVH